MMHMQVKQSWLDVLLGLVGLGIALAVTYFVAWDVPWLLIFTGMYLLGIVVAWAWDKWTGYEKEYAILVTIISYLVGIYLLLGGSAWRIITSQWCGIPPCVPMFWPLLVLILGNLVYIGRGYIKGFAQK